LAAKHRGPKPRPRLEGYRKALAGAPDWDAYLRRNSGLPGPRANLELAQAAAESASPARIRRWCAISPEHGSDDEYLAFCGVIGLGILAARGSKPALGRLGLFASDPRWRIREAVALGLQLVGDRDWDQLLRTARSWAAKGTLPMRAAAAALAEPRLLQPSSRVRPALAILDRITRTVARTPAGKRDDDFRVLRQGLAYAWSVLVAAEPGVGKTYMEVWMRSSDSDVRWIMLQNLRKTRLERMDRAWVARWKRVLAPGGAKGSPK
jgi:hypothetical protein